MVNWRISPDLPVKRASKGRYSTSSRSDNLAAASKALIKLPQYVSPRALHTSVMICRPGGRPLSRVVTSSDRQRNVSPGSRVKDDKLQDRLSYEVERLWCREKPARK